MNWLPVHCHTHYSLLEALSKHDILIKRCVDLKYSSCCITDRGTISGCISFARECISKNVKPILGCEFNICKDTSSIKNVENSLLSNLCVIAKNSDGWKNLISLSSKSNSLECFYHKSRLQIDDFIGLSNGLIAFTGYIGSDLANCLFDDCKEAYLCSDYEQVKDLLNPNWMNRSIEVCSKHIEIFGLENFFVGIQIFDKENFPASCVVAECLRELCIKTNIKKIAFPNVRYVFSQDAADHRILICSLLESTLKTVKEKAEKTEDYLLSLFFKSNRYYLPSIDEIEELYEKDEIENCAVVDNLCENYLTIKEPSIPNFNCPNGLSQILYLRQLCREGWKKKFSYISSDTDQYKIYTDRIAHELNVIDKSGLSGYFLIVQDYCKWVKSNGWLMGPGRGSGAGCMISYLLGITDVDPIKNDLVFERFYNAGRNVLGRISLPDIDCDFPITKRDLVVNYIRSKYGEDHVSQMITFSRMQGRGSLKDVLRAHGFSFEESNRITKHIPDEAEISEQLQEIKDDVGESSIIRWALDNYSDKLSEFCRIDEKGKISGKLEKEFSQAIRLEGTKRSQGKHAAGIIISDLKLSQICPMIFDKKSKQSIAGLEMLDLESIGLVKFDILGVAVLDKIMGCVNFLKGKINER